MSHDDPDYRAAVNAETDDECHRCGTPHRRESSYCSEACADEAAYDEDMRRMLAAMHAEGGLS